jgi:hypothetical protein
MSNYNPANAKKDIAAFHAHKGAYNEGVFWKAYHAYASLGDYASANALREVAAHKFYGGFDAGHFNAMRYPYSTGELQMNSTGQLLGYPRMSTMPSDYHVVDGVLYLGGKPYN